MGLISIKSRKKDNILKKLLSYRGFPVAGSWKSFDQKKFENLFEDVKIYFLS